MEILTTDELAQVLAGGDSYIRTKDNVVKGLAVTTDKNPRAPEIIVVGTGLRVIANAKLLLEQQQYVPVYVKQSTNSWRHMGDYRAEKYSQENSVIDKYRGDRSRDSVNGILFLSSRDDVSVNISSPSFPDAETRGKVEKAAVNFVTKRYSDLGYSVKDRQKDNCGYDLLIEKGKEVLKVEVKGTSSTDQRFFLSRNERSKSADPLWRLAIVVNALVSPELEVLNATQMEKRFKFDALCWECVPL